MKRWRVEPVDPGAVDAFGVHVPPGGAELELDDDTAVRLSGDARVTIERAPETPPARPRPHRNSGRKRR